MRDEQASISKYKFFSAPLRRLNSFVVLVDAAAYARVVIFHGNGAMFTKSSVLCRRTETPSKISGVLWSIFLPAQRLCVCRTRRQACDGHRMAGPYEAWQLLTGSCEGPLLVTHEKACPMCCCSGVASTPGAHRLGPVIPDLSLLETWFAEPGPTIGSNKQSCKRLDLLSLQ
ncbi:hypothetical protein BHM03_00042886 [Ensete ventricosum]|nr:hypothetical protein BHM03_00042886 [Ensete ventricosum]